MKYQNYLINIATLLRYQLSLAIPGGKIMVDEIKNLLLAGLGSAAYTYEKAAKLLEDLAEKGKLTMEESKDLSQELKKNFKEKSEKIMPATKEDINKLVKEMNLVSKVEFDKLNERVVRLEALLQQKDPS